MTNRLTIAPATVAFLANHPKAMRAAPPRLRIRRRSQLRLGVILVAKCEYVIRHTGGRPVTIYPGERFRIIAQELESGRYWVRIVREESRRRVNGWAVPVSGVPHLFKLAT